MAKALNIPTFSIFSPPIKKENWSIYEDGIRNISVHLRDFRPELFKGITKKEIRESSSEFYSLLKPELFEDKLELFYKHNLEKK